MRLNKPDNLSTVDHLVFNDQPINIVDDFKYLGSYVGPIEHDVQVWIGRAWAPLSKLKSIQRSPKPKLNLKIHILKQHASRYFCMARDMDTYGCIYRETLHLCKDMLSNYAGYLAIARPCNKWITLSTS